MSIPVSSLRPTFVAILAFERFFIFVQAEVVVEAAQLLELFPTCFAGQYLIHSFSNFIACIGNRVLIEFLRLEPVVQLLLFDRLSFQVAHVGARAVEVLQRQRIDRLHTAIVCGEELGFPLI